MTFWRRIFSRLRVSSLRLLLKFGVRSWHRSRTVSGVKRLRECDRDRLFLSPWSEQRRFPCFHFSLFQSVVSLVGISSIQNESRLALTFVGVLLFDGDGIANSCSSFHRRRTLFSSNVMVAILFLNVSRKWRRKYEHNVTSTFSATSRTKCETDVWNILICFILQAKNVWVEQSKQANLNLKRNYQTLYIV